MKYKQIIWVLVLLAPVLIISCNKKDAYMGYTPGKGAPTITSVHTLSKTVYNDTTVTTHQSYDTSGKLTTVVDTVVGNSTAGFDSVTTVGNLGNLYVIHGTNLGSATGVYFNGTQAYFNRALGSDETIVVQVPSVGVPTSGTAATDTLTVTTLYGMAKYHFVILAPPPTINALSDYDFSNGSQITLSGLSFGGVQSVTLKGLSTSNVSKGLTATNISIVKQTDSVLTLQFGSTNITQGNLVFVYKQSDGTVDTATSSIVFNNMDNAEPIFMESAAPGWGSWSWGSAGASTAYAHNGTYSFMADFGASSWAIDGFRYGGGTATDGLAYSPDYQYLSFWVKGGAISANVYIEWGNEGFGNSTTDNAINKITILPNTWQFFKVPVSTLLWNTGKTNWSSNSAQLLNCVAFFLDPQDGSSAVDQTFYFDNIVLIK